ncbi:MAG: hypothetical protein JWN69_1276 [Alphaproteobacteria bacterium]|nr:hypothetical protein [Alphaproteobacteria bacterium]
MANQYQQKGGRQVGGGPEASDQQAGGGSSGTGGYGKIQDRMQGRQEQGIDDERRDPLLDRGEAFDEAQGGGRDDQALSSRGWTEPQGEGGGLESQMHQHERGGLTSDETERDAES